MSSVFQTPTPPATARGDKLPLASLIALASATFVSVTIEMLPTGLMPFMAPDLGVSEAQIGFLMTVFALCVIITSAPLTHVLRNVPRHTLLIGVLLLFCVGSLGTALAPSYPFIVLSRIVAGIAHGVLWATIAAYASLITPKHLMAQGLSITLSGGSTAFVLGVPLGTALGQLFGWRMTFAVLVVVALIVAGILYKLLPRVDHLAEDNFTQPITLPEPVATAAATSPHALAEQVGAVRARPAVHPKTMGAVALMSAITAITMFGHYAFYSYISPYMTDVMGVAHEHLSLMLFAYGILSAIATLAMGLLFGSRPILGIFLNLGMALAAGTIMLTVAPTSTVGGVIGLGMWGLAMGFLPPLYQSRILVLSPSHKRDLSSAIYSSCFNVGIGGGSFVGGILLDRAGIMTLPTTFLIFMSIAIVAALGAWRLLANGRQQADERARGRAEAQAPSA